MKLEVIQAFDGFEIGDTVETTDSYAKSLIADNKCVELTQKHEVKRIADEIKKIEKPVEQEFVPTSAIIVPKDEYKVQSIGQLCTHIMRAAYDSRESKDWIEHAVAGNNITTAADGGVMVPTTILGEITGPAKMPYGKIYDLCRKIPVGQAGAVKIPNAKWTTNTAATGSYTTFGGVVVYDLAEGDQITVSKPTFDSVTLTPKTKAAILAVSEQLLQDSPVTVMQQLQFDVPAAIRMALDKQIIAGTGTNQFAGLVGHTSAVTVSRSTTGSASGTAINLADINAMYAALYDDTNAVWIMNPKAFEQVMNLTNYISWNSLDGRPSLSLLGIPVIKAPWATATLGTTGDIVLADMSQYAIGVKSTEVEMAESIHVYFDTYQRAFRFVLRADGGPTWYDAITVDGTNATSWAVILD